MGINITGLIIMLFAVTPLFSQNRDYCKNEQGLKITNFNDLERDSLYVSYDEDSSGLTFKIVNTTEDTVYLFKSYLSADLSSSEYIHRIDIKEDFYKISFLPLIPYMSTKQTDKLILGSDRIVNKGQVMYDFVKLSPGTYFEYQAKYSNLFKGKRSCLVCDFSPSETSKFKPIKFKYIKPEKLKERLSLVFEFAIYDEVDLLCEQSAYYLDEFEFDKQAKSFKSLTVPVEIEQYADPLF